MPANGRVKKLLAIVISAAAVTSSCTGATERRPDLSDFRSVLPSGTHLTQVKGANDCEGNECIVHARLESNMGPDVLIAKLIERLLLAGWTRQPPAYAGQSSFCKHGVFVGFSTADAERNDDVQTASDVVPRSDQVYVYAASTGDC